MPFTDCLRHAIFQSVSIGSTTGFATSDFNEWPSFSRNILLLLMFIGGCSGSTAGGIKISRFIILVKAGWAELLRILHPHIVYSVKLGKKDIDPVIVANITRFFFLIYFCVRYFKRFDFLIRYIFNGIYWFDCCLHEQCRSCLWYCRSYYYL